MKIKFSKIIISVFILSVASCNNASENENDKSPQQISDSLAVTQSAFVQAVILENKLLHDSLNIDLRTTLASYYYSSGELNKAASHFLIICRQDPKNIYALKSLGNIYYDNKDDDNAILFYEKVLVINPGDIDTRCDLATCYSRINKLKKAISLLKENIKMDYGHMKSHYNLSVILKQSGKIDEAKAEMVICDSINSGLK